ncbi:MAG: DUF1636 family protein [Shimia sp.]|uniref:DUF1636 family protein n=1 Tax=Shimia sp. TaxID=1954381 RepID=UPI004059D805
MKHTLFVCDTCAAQRQSPQGAAFAKTLQEAAQNDPSLKSLTIEGVSCLNVCSEPLAIALRAPDKNAYLFAGINPDTDLADTLALARLYTKAQHGIISDARPAGRLRHCLKGRIPAL